MSIRPQQMDPAAMTTVEAHYCTPATPTSQMFCDLMGHIRWQEAQLDRAKVDPAYFATEPGVIQPDKEHAGKFVFESTSKIREKAEQAVPASKKDKQMPKPGPPKIHTETSTRQMRTVPPGTKCNTPHGHGGS